MIEIQQNIVIFTATAAIIVSTVAMFMLQRHYKKGKSSVDGTGHPSGQKTVKEMKPPADDKWIEVGKVASLHIYPLKSGRKVNLFKADATEIGLQEICRKGRIPLRDRVFILFKEDDNTFISGKTHPKLFKLTVNSLSNNTVEFSFDNEKTTFKLPDNNGKNTIDMRKEIIPSIDCGDEIASWVSKVLIGKDKALRVGYWPGSERRDISQVYGKWMEIYNDLCNDFVGAYSDVSSYLIINQASVDDLNFRINDRNSRVTSDQFRPNIVVNGPIAYSEDEWNWIKIGEEAIFKTFKPCVRCSVTTINPETLERSSTYEPIKTLKSYRQVQDEEKRKVDGSDPKMGMYMGLYASGQIKVGDPILISKE